MINFLKLKSRFNYLLAGIIALILFPNCSFGQESNLGNWMIYIGNQKIKTKWNWHHEVHYRNYDAAGDLEQLLLRTGIGYNLKENNDNLLLGYGFIRSENYGAEDNNKIVINEHRIFQQFITKHKLGVVALQHRFRFEQRFIEDDQKLRLRYFLGLGLGLTNKEIVDKTLYLSAYTEFFFNTNDDIFDRNRLYGGLGYKFSKKVKAELGYMNQFLGNGNNRDQINIIVFVNFFNKSTSK